MSRFGIAKVLLALVCCSLVHSPDKARALQTEPTAEAGIYKVFQERIKAASQGQPTDTDAIEAEIESGVVKQIEFFVAQANLTADEKTMAIAGRAGESKELVDCLVTMLFCELRCDPISDMERRLIRRTLESLDVRINWDYSIVTEAIPPEKTVVRIRLPDLHPCGGCKRVLESALDSTDGFENAMVDLETRTVQFLADVNLDVESKLDEMEKAGVNQLANWKLVRK